MNSLKQIPTMGILAAFAEAVRLVDWVVIAIIFIIASTMGSWLLPRTHPFPLPSYLFPSSSSNTSSPVSGIQTMPPNPTGGSTVPYSIVLIVSLAIPLLLIFLLTTFLSRTPHHADIKPATYRLKLRLANTYILGLLLSLSLTLFATDLLKNVIGKQRPDFWGRCGGVVQDVELVNKYTIPDYGFSVDGSGTRMVTWEVCKNYYNDVKRPANTSSGVKYVSRGALQEGWRSFPSGHASMAFAGLGYLALFLGYAFGVFGDRKSVV